MSHFDDPTSHDTIGICALDVNGDLAVACTTSGLSWKTPGRVGDSPIIGSGLYVDNDIGAAAATGDGDEIMKACVSYRVVMEMERGADPQAACEEALRYLLRKRGAFMSQGAACIALRKDGAFGGAATEMGFQPAARSWVYAVGDRSGVVVLEGSYVSEHQW